MQLLIGLILVLVAHTLLRAFLPARPGLAIAAGVVAAGVLVLRFGDQILTLPFWAGLIGFAAILSALLVVIHPNPMMSVLFLILNLFCVALFFLMLQAEFLAAIQIIIYAGAIMVLFLFVIMLLNLRAEEALRPGVGSARWAALALGGLFAGLMFVAIRGRDDPSYFEPGLFPGGFGTAREVGMMLFGEHLFAFEAASILLVGAMVGAVVLAQRRL